MINRLEKARQHIMLNLPGLVSDEEYLKVLCRLDSIEDDILDEGDVNNGKFQL